MRVNIASHAAGTMCGNTEWRVGSAARITARWSISVRYSESMSRTDDPHSPAAVVTGVWAGSTFVL